MTPNKLLACTGTALALAACSQKEERPNSSTSTPPKLPVEHFGKLKDGRETRVYTLSNKNGLTAGISDFGATLVSLEVPDREGKLADITHGYDSVSGYDSEQNPYLGASVGRFGNRIAKGKFTLDGQQFLLATNNAPSNIPCHLHGGTRGFNRRIWTLKDSTPPNSITLEYISPAGEEGYPGTLTTTVAYTLTDDNELIWEARATTDATTIINLIHHTFWNLSGDPTRSIDEHILTLHAEHFLPTNHGMIPTGERLPVAGTPMDFTQASAIGERINADFEAIKVGNGYDHCWLLSNPQPDGLELAARLQDPISGRVMELSTNQPAIQLYTGNFLASSHYSGDHQPGKNGVAYTFRSALCLETENFPDAPNQPGFPSPVLKPGETYRHIMVHKFSVE